MPRLILASASPRRRVLMRAAGFDFEVVPADIDEAALTYGRDATATVRRIARAKALAVAAAYPDDWLLAADTLVVLRGALLGKPTDAAEARRMLQALAGRWHRVVTGVCVISPRQAGPEATSRPLAEPGAPTASEPGWAVTGTGGIGPPQVVGSDTAPRPLEEPGPSPASEPDGAGSGLCRVTPPRRTRLRLTHAATRVMLRRLGEDEIEASIARGEPFDKAGAYAIQDGLLAPIHAYNGCYCNVVGLPLFPAMRLLAEAGCLPSREAALPSQCSGCPLAAG